MAKKKSTTKKATKKPTKKTHTSSKVTLEDIHKRMIRLEKLILLLIDDSYLHEKERARVSEIERLVKSGELDKLSDM